MTNHDWEQIVNIKNKQTKQASTRSRGRRIKALPSWQPARHWPSQGGGGGVGGWRIVDHKIRQICGFGHKVFNQLLEIFRS